VRQIRMLRAMRRELETALRILLTGHEGGNPGYSQGESYGLPRQLSTLPASAVHDPAFLDSSGHAGAIGFLATSAPSAPSETYSSIAIAAGASHPASCIHSLTSAARCTRPARVRMARWNA